jgi:hypothetical protein
LQLRQQLAYAVDGLDDIRPRLPVDKEQNPRFAIDQTIVAYIFDRIPDGGDIGKPYRPAIVVGEDERLVFYGLQQLVRGTERPGTTAAGNFSFRAVGVGVVQHRPHILQAQAVTLQNGGINLHPYRG